MTRVATLLKPRFVRTVCGFGYAFAGEAEAANPRESPRPVSLRASCGRSATSLSSKARERAALGRLPMSRWRRLSLISRS